ncbi:MAG: hypothetical protein ACYTHJ_09045 [Planctomycetota bacterium]
MIAIIPFIMTTQTTKGIRMKTYWLPTAYCLVFFSGLPSFGQMIYWADRDVHKIERSFLDGTGREDVAAIPGSQPQGVAIHYASNTLFWADNTTNTIYQSNLDGTDRIPFVDTGLSNPWGLAVDQVNDMVYWTDFGTLRIQRSDLSGTNIEDLVTTDLSRPRGIAVSPAAGFAYWADEVLGTISRIPIDGGEAEVIVSGVNSPVGLAVDEDHEALYWSSFFNERIERSDLDGNDPVSLGTGEVGGALALTVDSLVGQVYWTDNSTNAVRRMVTRMERIDSPITTGLDTPVGIALDLRLRGDCDQGGLIDLADYAQFDVCLAGPDASYDPSCRCLDFDGSATVDLFDYAAYARAHEATP